MAKKNDQAITSVPLQYPVVRRISEMEANWKFTDDQMLELETEGKVSFSADQRGDLTTLALNWCSELALRKSARPKAFRDRLSKMSKSLRTAQVALRLNASDASELDRHLLHWIIDSPEGRHLVGELEALDAQIERKIAAVDRLQKSLPPDPGRARPHSDKHLIINLADIYEKAGGTAMAYRSEHRSDGFADTLFRRFAQLFYSKLPSEDKRKRKPSGFDEALVDALAARRRARGG